MRVRIRFVAVLAVLALVGAACGGDDASPAETTTSVAVATTTTVQTATTTIAPTTSISATTTAAPTTTSPLPAEPRTVEANGAEFAYECRGEGSPIVIVEHGLGGPTEPDSDWDEWGEALDGIADLTQVCTYGRRGRLGSDPLPRDVVRTTLDQVEDLDAVVVALGLEMPLVLVGHSQAGHNLRVYTDQYPDKVAGLVFVDSVHPDLDLLDDDVESPSASTEWLDYLASAEQAEATGDLGDLPIYVLSAGVDSSSEWDEWQLELAALSTDTRQKTVTSHHGIHVVNPAAIVAAVQSVLKRLGET